MPRAASSATRVRRSTAIAIMAAAVVLGVALVGLVVRLGADRLPTGPALPPPSPTPAGLQFDAETRKASYENVSVTLAGDPYYCADKPASMGPFDQAAACSYLVHKDYSGSSSWSADTGFALVPGALAVAGDPEGSARAVFQQSLSLAYPESAKVSELKVGPLASSSDAAVLSAHVNVSVPKLPTSYDVVVIAVLTAKDDQQVVFYSFKPNDAGDQALHALQESADTLLTS